MTAGDTDLESMNPTELLREQTRLLQEISILIIDVQLEQQRAYTQAANLTEFVEAIHTGGIRSSVSDVDLPISSMMQLMVKWVIAAIPVAIVLGFLAGLLSSCWGLSAF